MNVMDRLAAYIFGHPHVLLDQPAPSRQYQLTALPPLRSEWDTESVIVVCDGTRRKFHWLTDTRDIIPTVHEHDIKTGAMRIYTPADLREIIPCGTSREGYMRQRGWRDHENI